MNSFPCTYWSSVYHLRKECLFRSFANFFIGLFVLLLLNCMNYYIFQILSPYQIYGLQIFFPIPWLFFHFVNHFFAVQKLFGLRQSHVFPFDFIACALCVITKKIIAKTHVKELSSYEMFNLTNLLLHISILCKSYMVVGLPLWLSW